MFISKNGMLGLKSPHDRVNLPLLPGEGDLGPNHGFHSTDLEKKKTLEE